MKILLVRIRKGDKDTFFQCSNMEEFEQYKTIAKENDWQFDYRLLEAEELFD